MAQSSDCQSPQNPLFSSKNNLASAFSTEDNNTPTISYISTLTPAVTPPIGLALFFLARYLKDDLKQILGTVLDFRPVALPQAPALALHYKGPCKRLLKAWFSDVY